MTIPLKTQIKQAVRRLNTLRAEEKSFNWTEGVAKSRTDNLLQLETVLLEAENRHLRFENQVKKLESAQKEFVTVIKKGTASERLGENSAYEALVSELKVDEELEASELLMSLILRRVTLLKAEQRRLQGPNLTETLTTTASTVQVPTIRLHAFRGLRAEWQEWYEMFKLSIHDHPKLAAVEKMTHLRSLLDGEAKEFIAGLSIQEPNYEIALELLKSKYGNTEVVIRELHQQLVSLKSCQAFEEYQKFLLSLDKIVRLLKNNKQDVEGPAVWLSLEQKMTPKGAGKSFLRAILEKKTLDPDWNTTKFIACLEELVRKEEAFRGVCFQFNVENKSCELSRKKPGRFFKTQR